MIFFMNIGRDRAEQMQNFDDQKFGQWLGAMAMPIWFLNASPDSSILHQAPTTFEGQRASAAQVRIPGGSPLVVLDATGKGKRMDSVRGLVFFVRGSYVYMLGTELRSTAFALRKPHDATPGVEEPSSPQDDWMKFVDRLKPFYATIEFDD